MPGWAEEEMIDKSKGIQNLFKVSQDILGASFVSFCF